MREFRCKCGIEYMLLDGTYEFKCDFCGKRYALVVQDQDVSPDAILPLFD